VSGFVHLLLCAARIFIGIQCAAHFLPPWIDGIISLPDDKIRKECSAAGTGERAPPLLC
jgi:hypothetical protein